MSVGQWEQVLSFQYHISIVSVPDVDVLLETEEMTLLMCCGTAAIELSSYVTPNTIGFSIPRRANPCILC